MCQMVTSVKLAPGQVKLGGPMEELVRLWAPRVHISEKAVLTFCYTYNLEKV